MGNLFLGFPVARAKIADMISTSAPPLAHHAQHENGGSDEIDATGLTGAGGGGIGIADFFIYGSTGEAITGWNQTNIGSGSSSAGYPGLSLQTGTTASSQALITKGPGYAAPMLTFSKDRIFVTNIRFVSPTSVTGTFDICSGGITTQKHIGFKVVDGVLKGSVGNGTTETTVDLQTLGTGTYTVQRDLKAVFTTGVKCEFYVDGVLLGEITTNLPSGVASIPTLVSFNAENPGVTQNKQTYPTFYYVAIKF